MFDQIAIEASRLRKSYGNHAVLDGIDLRVARGSVFALLGPNGAGKTTTVRILATLVAPDGGQARVAGHDVIAQRREVRHRISLTGQYAAVDELQTGRENMTTQYLEEADSLADRIAVLDGGAIVAEGTSHELKQQVAGQRLDLQLADVAAFQIVSELLGDRATHVDRELLSLGVATEGSAPDVRRLLDELDPERSRVARFAVVQASLC